MIKPRKKRRRLRCWRASSLQSRLQQRSHRLTLRKRFTRTFLKSAYLKSMRISRLKRKSFSESGLRSERLRVCLAAWSAMPVKKQWMLHQTLRRISQQASLQRQEKQRRQRSWKTLLMSRNSRRALEVFKLVQLQAKLKSNHLTLRSSARRLSRVYWSSSVFCQMGTCTILIAT